MKKDDGKGEDDYSDKKYDQDEEQIRKMEGISQSKKGSKHKIEEEKESADELLNKFMGDSEQLFSKNDQEFKHWSDDSSNKAIDGLQKQNSLPQMLIKVSKHQIEKYVEK